MNNRSPALWGCGGAGKACVKVRICNAAEMKGGHCTLFEGHCTSKNGASPELTLIKAPLLETSVRATVGKTGDSRLSAVQFLRRRTS